MELALALAIGVLAGGGIYLLLSSRTFDVILGLTTADDILDDLSTAEEVDAIVIDETVIDEGFLGWPGDDEPTGGDK